MEGKEKQSWIVQRNSPTQRRNLQTRSGRQHQEPQKCQGSSQSPSVTLTRAVSGKLKQWKPEDRSSVKSLLNSKWFQNRNSPFSIKPIELLKPQIAGCKVFFHRKGIFKRVKNHKSCLKWSFLLSSYPPPEVGPREGEKLANSLLPKNWRRKKNV